MRYRAKTAAIEAFQITKESAIYWGDWPNWMLQLANNETIRPLWSDNNPDRSMVWVEEGVEAIKWNSWIVKDGEHYRIMEDAEFQRYYEPIPEFDPKTGSVKDMWLEGIGCGILMLYGGLTVGKLEAYLPEEATFPSGSSKVWIKYVNRKPPDA